jgi:hypothetical protein
MHQPDARIICDKCEDYKAGTWKESCITAWWVDEVEGRVAAVTAISGS